AIRVDTSGTMVDKYFLRNEHLMGTFDPTGVNPELIFALRKALDDEGYTFVNIVVSGGITEERIEYFESQNLTVYMCASGRSLRKINQSFTGGYVLLNGTRYA